MFAAALQLARRSVRSSATPVRAFDWRLLVCGLIIGAALLPSLWIVISQVDVGLLTVVPHGASVAALKRTFLLFAVVISGALVLGLPLGALLGLVRLPFQRLLLAALAVPLFTPASLWAIGISFVRPLLAYRNQGWFDGLWGALLTGLVQALPLVVFASYFLSRTLPGSQIDAALLAGGWRALLRLANRFCFPAAIAAAVLGGLIAIADPGPAQIMGYHGMASEVFIAFSARSDPLLAAQKVLTMTLFLLPILVPLAWFTAVWSEACFLGRDLRRVRPKLFSIYPGLMLLVFGALSMAFLSIPIMGFVRPLNSSQTSQSFHLAWTILKQSAPATFRYGFTAAVLASILGLFLTLAAGRKHQGRFLLLLFCFVFLSIPTALHALGFAAIGSQLPQYFDVFSRGANAPGIAFGLRWLPIPTLFCLRALSLIPEASHESALLHGIPAFQYHLRVTLPQLLPVLLCAVLVVALETAADVSGTLILLPPGAGTYTTRIFGVIDSTTERTLSALCLVYIGMGFAALSLTSLLFRARPRS
jgi:iron(III) transport system permease protein